jgi:hypothetical protein
MKDPVYIVMKDPVYIVMKDPVYIVMMVDAYIVHLGLYINIFFNLSLWITI